MYVKNLTRGTTVGSHITLANTSLTRLVGLLGKRELDAGCGLLIQPSSGVHTFGMRFPIDVVALSQDFRVLRLWHRLGPQRLTGLSLKTRCVLELPAGKIHHTQTQVGDQMEISETL
jgi:uncharacterized protein